MTTNRYDNYLALLTIRRTARCRDTTIFGGTFAISFIATIALGMLDRLSGRPLYFVTAMVVVFGFAYLTSWVRFEIIKGSIELIDNLLLMNKERDNG